MESGYRPWLNPRWLGEEILPDVPDPVDVEQATQDIGPLSEAVATFSTSGWYHVAATLQARVELLKASLLSDRVDSIESVFRLRGEIRALELLLALPADWGAQHNKSAEILAAVTSSNGELDEREEDHRA